jgi:hypothetical protein
MFGRMNASCTVGGLRRGAIVVALTASGLAGCGASQQSADRSLASSPHHAFGEKVYMTPIRSAGRYAIGEGRGTGTLDARFRFTIDQLTLAMSFRATTPDGSIAGDASVPQSSIHRSAAEGTFTFTGTGSVTSGTGVFSRARARDLGITGTVVPGISTKFTVWLSGVLRY